MIEKFLIGTYTINNSDGVYQIELDNDKKQLQNAHLVAKIESPTYLAESEQHMLYAVDRNMDNPDLRGGVAVFDMNQLPAKLLQENIETGTSDAYVSIDKERQLVYTANYHMGYVSVYKIQPDGTLKIADRLIVCDLGTDKVNIYDVADDGKLTEVSEFNNIPGFGPRNIEFNPETNKGYLVGELSSMVAVLDYDPQTAKLTLSQSQSTIPSDWTEHNGAAAIKISADHRFVYISNRGNDSIVVFKILVDGNLQKVQLISTEGEFPRDFNFNADQSMIIAVNQNSDNATLYERDAETGKLTLIQKDFAVPEGTCVMRRV